MSLIEHRRREPAPGVFRLVLPLPFPGLDRVNAYLLADEGGSTLIDCGIYFPDAAEGHGWDDLVAALAQCDHSPSDIKRLIVTHPHIDHYGMAGLLMVETGCDLWMQGMADIELEAYRSPETSRGRLRAVLSTHGVSDEELDELTAFEDWRPYVSKVVDPTGWLHDKETVKVGSREWEIVYTPGHSPSHVCLWSGEDGILIAGDHLLPTVTPHIDFKGWEAEDPLGEFLTSLERIEGLDPKLVLAGHGRPFTEGAERARVIARHHDRRLGSILQVIRHRPATADFITDEIFGTSLLNFQRRLAVGEALAHLAYLRKRGEVERIQDEDGKYTYKKASRRHTSEVDD